jgi:hypothetical protein
MTSTVMASGVAMPHIMYDAIMVPSALSGSGKCSATLAPVLAATMEAAIGSNCAAVIRSRACRCDAEMSKTVSEMVTATATIESIIQQTQAIVTAHGPQYGMHNEHQAEMRVAKPIGIVPRKSELTLSAIMTVQISGYTVYRNTEMENAQVNSIAFSPKNATESQYSHSVSKGIAARSRDTMPVPMVTLNQEGEKLRTILRQPT